MSAEDPLDSPSRVLTIDSVKRKKAQERQWRVIQAQIIAALASMPGSSTDRRYPISREEWIELEKQYDGTPPEDWVSLECMGCDSLEASTHGNFRHPITKKFRCHRRDRGGYRPLNIYILGKSVRWKAHQIIGLLFVLQPEGENLTVDHIGRDPADNKAWCLRWADKRLQIRNRNPLKCAKPPMRVLQYDMKMELVKIWDSALQTMNDGYSESSIRHACKGEKPHRGFFWKYEPKTQVEVLPGEKWVQIPFPGYDRYWISNMGRIRLLSGEITLGFVKGGYLNMCMYKESGDFVTLPIHRLVIVIFRGEIADEMVVDHLNNNPLDNRLENLEVVSESTNVRRANADGLIDRTGQYRSVTRIHPTSGEIMQIYENMSIPRTIYNDRHISAVCKGTRNQSRGWVWKYTDDQDPEFQRKLQAYMEAGCPILDDPTVVSKNGPVVALDPITEKIVHYYACCTDAAKAHNFSNSSRIHDVVRGHRKTTRGYIWRLASDPLIADQVMAYLQARESVAQS